MKKLICLLALITTAASLASCGDKIEPTDGNIKIQTSAAAETTQTAAESSSSAESSDTKSKDDSSSKQKETTAKKETSKAEETTKKAENTKAKTTKKQENLYDKEFKENLVSSINWDDFTALNVSETDNVEMTTYKSSDGTKAIYTIKYKSSSTEDNIRNFIDTADFINESTNFSEVMCLGYENDNLFGLNRFSGNQSVFGYLWLDQTYQDTYDKIKDELN